MELLPSLLFFAAHWAVYSADQFEIQLASGAQWIFSGETVNLKCVLVDGERSDWTSVLWFRDGQLLPGRNFQDLNLWQVKVYESGNYSCQGKRTTSREPIYTAPSKDFELDVDGGWAILRLEQDVRVGETLLAACLVRDTPVLKEVILYKDGREVLTQNGPNADLSLVNVNVQDSGLYSCRATWDSNTGMQSAQSKPIKVTVIGESLPQPETLAPLQPAGRPDHAPSAPPLQPNHPPSHPPPANTSSQSNPPHSLPPDEASGDSPDVVH